LIRVERSYHWAKSTFLRISHTLERHAAAPDVWRASYTQEEIAEYFEVLEWGDSYSIARETPCQAAAEAQCGACGGGFGVNLAWQRELSKLKDRLGRYFRGAS
jgi:hypothetical protein